LKASINPSAVHTSVEESGYVRSDQSNEQRNALLVTGAHRYNYHRAHTALGRRSPIERINKLCGNYT